MTGPRLGVLGWPVAHSLSPRIHNAALAEVGLGDWRYQLLPVPPELFGETVQALPAAGFVGASVTVPHKEAALAVADEAGEAARSRRASMASEEPDARPKVATARAPLASIRVTPTDAVQSSPPASMQ